LGQFINAGAPQQAANRSHSGVIYAHRDPAVRIFLIYSQGPELVDAKYRSTPPETFLPEKDRSPACDLY